MKEKRLWGSLAIFVLFCFLVEIIGGIWTRESVMTWYPQLSKPFWTPPSWVFGPVWTTLYVMIAVSGWLIYRSEPSAMRSKALVFYGIQLALNFIWSFLFFSLQNPALALIDIAFLVVAILLTIVNAWPVNRVAGWLLFPYLVWVLYAASLNMGIWILNG